MLASGGQFGLGIGIDETSLRRGQHYITVVRDLAARRLLFATPGRDHQTVVEFVQDIQAHGGDPAHVQHVCMDMSAAYAKGVELALAQAQISYDRFHFVAMANEAMNGQLQQAKRAARGFKTAGNFIAIAYLRMSKLKHLPSSPFALAAPI